MLPVVGLNQEVNLTAVLLPLNPNLTVFYWWIGHSLQVRWARDPTGSHLGESGAGQCPGAWAEGHRVLHGGLEVGTHQPFFPSTCSCLAESKRGGRRIKWTRHCLFLGREV